LKSPNTVFAITSFGYLAMIAPTLDSYVIENELYVLVGYDNAAVNTQTPCVVYISANIL